MEAKLGGRWMRQRDGEGGRAEEEQWAGNQLPTRRTTLKSDIELKAVACIDAGVYIHIQDLYTW